MQIKLKDLRKIVREELVAISPTTDYVLPSGNTQDADPMAPVVQARAVGRILHEHGRLVQPNFRGL